MLDLPKKTLLFMIDLFDEGGNNKTYRHDTLINIIGSGWWWSSRFPPVRSAYLVPCGAAPVVLRNKARLRHYFRACLDYLTKQSDIHLTKLGIIFLDFVIIFYNEISLHTNTVHDSLSYSKYCIVILNNYANFLYRT